MDQLSACRSSYFWAPEIVGLLLYSVYKTPSIKGNFDLFQIHCGHTVPCLSMQAESTLSRQASESERAESNPSTLMQEDISTSEDQEASDHAEQVSATAILSLHWTTQGIT